MAAAPPQAPAVAQPAAEPVASSCPGAGGGSTARGSDQTLSQYHPLRFSSGTSSAKTKSAEFTGTHMAQFRVPSFRKTKFKKPWSFSFNSFNATEYSKTARAR